MLGKYIKSLNHLKHSLTYDIATPFIMHCFGYEPIEGEVVKIKIDNKDYLFLFNNAFTDGDMSFNNLLSLVDDKKIDLLTLLRQKYTYFVEYHEFNKTDQVIFSRYSPFIITNETFYENYKKFCSDNKKKLSNVLDFYGTNHVFCKLMYILCDGSSNMFLWALTNFRKRVPFHLIVEILYWFTNYKSFNGKVTKGTFTAYNDTSSILKLRNELILLRQEKRITKVFNMFNTYQKKLLKNTTLNKVQKEMISHFETMSKEKQLNFIRKVSTMENVDDIFHQMAILTKNHFEWNRESFLDFITNIDNLSFDIIYDNSDIIILKVNDYETVKYVTRTTNWCISKNKTYWNNYIGKENNVVSKQYVLFNFNEQEDSEYSIVGFTTKNDISITHAHSFTNNNLMCNHKNFQIEQLSTYDLPSIINIDDLLKNLSIPIDSIIKENTLPYQWKKDNVLEILSMINEYDCDIIKNDENILVVTIKSSNDIMKITGINQYVKMMNRLNFNPINNKHLFIFDFSKHEASKLLWTFTYDLLEKDVNERLFDSYGNMYNKSLYYVLSKYNLPFDIFSTPNGLLNILIKAFNTYDLNLLNVLLSDDNIKKRLKNKNLKNSINNCVLCSIYHYHSFDIIELLYSKGFLLSKLVDNALVNKLLSNALNQINQDNIPTKSDYEKLFSHKLNKDKIDSYANFYLFELIWSHEKKLDLLKDWILNMPNINSQVVLKYLIDCIKPYFNRIISKEKINAVAQAIIKSEYFEVLDSNLDTNLTKEIVNLLPSTHYLKESFVKKEV